MKIFRNRLSLQHVWAILAFVVVLAGFITSLMYYYATSYASLRPFVYGNSDMLQLASLYNDVANGVDVSGWKLSEASFFFPDVLLYFLVKSIIPSIFAAQSVYGVVQYLIFTLGLVILAKQILPCSYGSARYSLTALIALLFSLSISELQWVSNTVFVNEQHFGVVATIPWVLAMIYQLISKPRLKASLVSALSLLTILVGASDTLYVVQITAPLCGALIVLCFIKKLALKRMIVINGFLTLASLAGLGLNYVNPWTYPVQLTVFQPSLWYESFSMLMQSIQFIVLTTPLHATLAALVICMCIIILARNIVSYVSCRDATTIGVNRVLFPLYLLFATAANVLVMVMTGRMCGLACFRYFLPVSFFANWWGIPFVIRIPGSIKPAHFERVLLLALSLTIIVASSNISIQQLVKNTTGIYYPSLVQCMDENTAKLGVRYGISQYWQARPISMLSQNGLRVVTVFPDLTPHYWETNLAWYEIEPEFAIIDQSLPLGDDGRLDENLIIDRYGEPDASFQCGDSKVIVYRNPDSKLKTLFNNIQSK